MKTAKEFLQERWSNPEFRPGQEFVIELLKDYAKEVLNECSKLVDDDNMPWVLRFKKEQIR